MNQHLQKILDFIQQNEKLSTEEKTILLKAVKDTDSAFTISEFKLDRTEKVKQTTAILLEETMEELEQKRKAVEAQKRELEIESSLEKVRTVAMGMRKRDDLLEICKTVYTELLSLGFNELRNVMINIHNDDKDSLLNYDYSDNFGKTVTDIPYNFHPLVEKQVAVTRNAQDAFFEFSFTGEELKQFRELRKRNGEQDDTKLETTDSLHYYFFSIGTGSIGISTYSFINEEKLLLLKRFRNVFNLSYQRYTDISQAEAQAREAEIELALERIRARTMAMQHSDELADASLLLDQQIRGLGIKTRGCAFNIYGENESTEWFSNEMGTMHTYKTPREKVFLRYYEAGQKGETLLIKEFSGKECVDWYNYLCTLPVICDGLKEMIANGGSFPTRQIDHVSFFKYGYLLFLTFEHVPEAHDIFKRFAKVFEQTYTRFLDLQKAEEQAREAQIEAALEKVRSVALGLKKSDELLDIAEVLYNQLYNLGFKNIRNTIIDIHTDDKGGFLDYDYSPDMGQTITRMNYNDHPIIEKQVQEINASTDGFFEIILEGKDLEELIALRIKNGEHEDERLNKIKQLTYNLYSFGEGEIGISNFGLLEEEQKLLLKRFRNVFSFAYNRYSELKEAETRARELQIEAALEKVRSRSLSMHKSDELEEVVSMVFQKLHDLNMVVDGGVTISIYNELTNDQVHWVAAPDLIKSSHFNVPYADDKIIADNIKAKKSGIEYFAKIYPFEEKNGMLNYLFEYSDYKYLPEDVKNWVLQSENYAQSIAFSHNSSIFVNSYSGILLTEDEAEILKRFAKVFEQAYIRFLDLQKSEEQTRESHIETALERVRSRTLAMHKSEELSDAAATVFHQLQVLGISELRRSLVAIMNTAQTTWQIWYTTVEGESNTSFMAMPADGHPVAIGMMKSWLKRELIHIELEGLQLKSWMEYILANGWHYPEGEKPPEKFVIYGLPFSNGYLVAFTNNDILPAEVDLLKRFAKVFDQTYTRFLDLQKAEANAREAQIESGLERVRSRTLAMQKSDELADTEAELFKQLIFLGIAPNRLYIGIIKDEMGLIEIWATNEDGSQIANQFNLDISRNDSVKRMYNAWKQHQKSVTIIMEGDELSSYLSYLQNEFNIPFGSGRSQKRRVQTISYFSNGFIGMASPDDQPAETMELLNRFAAVFNLTFTRFNDLKMAEAHAIQAEHDLMEIMAARKSAETALVELQSTQKQLIQSEKMASLGELTAGIAHEIQNPLNFVNNFSEVSRELLAEMQEEIDKGNLDDAKEILHDIVQNLEKINHHGKRADGIVKGMLQHSRSTSGQKELSDINVLAEEYLRLSYHGLRAKDKTFNAKYKTDFDESLEKINIVPQDIGRVILNLLTNAFYAVNEKKKSGAEGYEPTVSISTKKMSDKVEIKISDNGNGIPQNIVDKIFQPFFTTKPTGQGTGLGLSLSYDIIKAHGGELKVETKEGEGTNFIIQIPS